MVWIWLLQHEPMDPTQPVQAAGGGGVAVWGPFSSVTLALLTYINHGLNSTGCLTIVVDHFHPFIATLPSSNGDF